MSNVKMIPHGNKDAQSIDKKEHILCSDECFHFAYM